MVEYFKENPDDSPTNIYNETITIIEKMNDVFSNSDSLLRSQGAITVYFLLFREARKNNNLEKITRTVIFSFYKKLEENRIIAGQDITLANFEYLEFERMTQQGTNDASSIKERTRIMAEFTGVIEKREHFSLGS